VWSYTRTQVRFHLLLVAIRQVLHGAPLCMTQFGARIPVMHTLMPTGWLPIQVKLTWLLQVLGDLAHAKIANHLASGPKTAAEVAALTGEHVSSVALLRQGPLPSKTQTNGTSEDTAYYQMSVPLPGMCPADGSSVEPLRYRAG
jgi:hypothetical protein